MAEVLVQVFIEDLHILPEDPLMEIVDDSSLLGAVVC
jgi:hypothetical protein